jgi:hypothetical protein
MGTDRTTTDTEMPGYCVEDIEALFVEAEAMFATMATSGLRDLGNTPDVDTLRALITDGLIGALSQESFRTLTGWTEGWSINMTGMYYRSFYCKAVSWAVYSTEFLDSMQRLLAGRRVLEVCAGRGVMSRVMRGRGEDWTATDLNPVTDDVEEMDAIEAVRQYKPDAIVASWIPYGSDLDVQLAEVARELGIPMVVIGEGNGGCTGSEAFWNRSRESYYDWQADDGEEEITNDSVDWSIEDLGSLFDWFVDVPRWDGINDYTSLVVPAGVTFVVEGKGVFGPPV